MDTCKRGSILRGRRISIMINYNLLRKCPCYEELRCYFVLSEDAPIPCFGNKEQCEQWRNMVIEKELWNPK